MATAKTNAFQGRPTAEIVGELQSVKALLLGVDERIAEILATKHPPGADNPLPPPAAKDRPKPAS